jgi:ADP-ribosyl-[dinitrogen reductase] hydrolase
MTLKSRLLGGLFGVCLGDALGIPVEGMPRGLLEKRPVRGFGRGGRVPPGWWSDDTSLTLCLVDSVVACGAIDPRDIATRFLRWIDEGYWTPAGRPFGMGRTTLESLHRFRRSGDPAASGGRDEYSNGNGSLMRILPLVFLCADQTPQQLVEKVSAVSSITHAHPRSVAACLFYVVLGMRLLRGMEPGNAYDETRREAPLLFRGTALEGESRSLSRVLDGSLATLDAGGVRSTGYVIHTLEAAVWCLLAERDLRGTILRAVNLGWDADTTGAVAGGLAGIHYGFEGIPAGWIDGLARSGDILRLAGDFHDLLSP